MSRFVYEGKTKVAWVTTLSSQSTPSAAVINAGTDLTNFVTKDGVAVNINTNNVDSATIAEIFDAQVVGSYGADVQLTMFRDDSADTAFTTCVYGTTGYLVIRRFIATASAWATGQKVEVWPAQMHQPAPENSATNTQVKFMESFAITSTPTLTATTTA